MKRHITLFLLFLLQPFAISLGSNPPNFLFLFIDDQGWNGTPVPMIPGGEFSKTPDFHMPNVERLAAHRIYVDNIDIGSQSLKRLGRLERRGVRPRRARQVAGTMPRR